LVLVAVGITTAAVAVVAHWLRPDMPWAVAIALGAIVAPPDAAAATAILRQVNLPYRIQKILEGESLLNDASALLIYRVCVGLVAAEHMKVHEFVPSIALALFGSLIAGFLFARVWAQITRRITEAPSAIITQFAGTFMVWIVAEHIGLSGILTIVGYAITIARTAAARSLLCGVGNHRVRAQRAGVHSDRHAAQSDLVRAQRRGAVPVLQLCRRDPRRRDPRPHRLGDTIWRPPARLERARPASFACVCRGTDRGTRHHRVLVRDARHRDPGGRLRIARALPVSRSHPADGVCRGAGDARAPGPDAAADNPRAEIR